MIDKTIKSLNKNSESYIKNLKEVDKATFATINDTEQYLKEFNKTSQACMKELGLTLEKFKKDLKDETLGASATMKALFKKLAENTDAQQKQSVDTLAAALIAINNQMINNYKALINRIAELDRIIQSNGGKK